MRGLRSSFSNKGWIEYVLAPEHVYLFRWATLLYRGACYAWQSEDISDAKKHGIDF